MKLTKFYARLHVCLLLTLFGLALTPRAAGQSALLRDAIGELNGANGPEAYTELRKIWDQWGSSDPLWVEEALLDVEDSKQFSPRIRDYAAFLVAHAHTRRGDEVGAKRAIHALGFVSDWLVLGPFDNEGKGGFATEYGPEAQFAEALVEGQAYDGKERAVRWRTAPAAFDFGWLNGGSLFRPEQNICFYAATFVRNEQPRARAVELLAGANGAFKLFVNGSKVLEDAAYRGHDVDRRGVEVELPQGSNALIVKVCGTEVAPILSLRVMPSDRQAAGVSRSARFLDSQDAAANHGRVKVRASGLGSLDQFEKRVAAKGAGAEAWEDYARYLVATHGDDPSTHSARDYARRAAEAQPTLERLLLAGALAEDYNRQRTWVQQAEALALKRGEKRASVALARALLEQGGLNWRDAYPHFVEAERRDPDNLQVIAGRVRLLNDAGLKVTALQILEQAVVRNPNAVTLLNLYASQLRELGRSQEADEVEARYARYRFDDSSALAQRLSLSLARDNRPAAEYWTGRLLALNPESLWAHSTAALAYRQLGQEERAIASYERALGLAPEDVQTLRSLADLQGELGHTGEQRRLLQQVLELQPQAKDVQEYLAHIEPEEPQRDESYAWDADRFLKKRGAPADGESRRTLLDLTVSTVFGNGLSSQFRQVVFQPLVESSAALSRNYSFQFQADTQRVQLRGARVFRADGRVDEAIETGIGAANDPSIAMYTSARTYNVQFPRLEAGDVVELRYRIDDIGHRNEFADYFGDIQYLQSGEVVGHAEYVLITPKARQFHIDHRGIPGLKTSSELVGEERIYRFFAEDIPPVVPEPMMAPWSEVLGFVHVSTYANFQELGTWYWGLVQDQFDLDDETRKLAREITAGLSDERAKVAAVYNWVIKNTRYVALEFGIYGFKPRRCVQTVSRGWGDCKDKATVIVSLLKELGIDSTIVILRTQMRGGFESKVASLAPFDHAIAYVPSLDLYLDGTAEYTGTRELPEMDQGALGIRVNQGRPEVVLLPRGTPEENVRRRELQLQVKADGAAQLSARFEVKGSDAPAWRRRYSAATSQRERMLSDLSHEFPGLELLPEETGLAVTVDNFEAPVQVKLRGRAPSYARREGSGLSLPVTTRTRLLDDYAALSQRALDVKIGTFGSVEDRFEVQLPEGYHVSSAPSDINVDTRFGSFSIKLLRDGQRVTVESRIAVKVSRVSPQDYAAWRSFCQAADSAMSARLVLSK